MNLALSADQMAEPSTSPYSKKRSNQEEIEDLSSVEGQYQDPDFVLPVEDEQQVQHLRRQKQILIEAAAGKSDEEYLHPNQDQQKRFGANEIRHQRLSNISDSSAEYNDDIFNMTEQSVKNQTILRVIFSCGFLLMLFYTMFNVERQDVITRQQCMKDYTFIATEKINQFLIENLDVKNRYIIFCSFLMDVMIISLLSLFYVNWKTYRLAFAYILFFVCRAFLQQNFFMTRLEGFTFFDPGMYSITVPYHDVNDFFYSGHVGTCMLVYLEFRSAKYYKLSYFVMFILINEWLMLCLVRTHYIIDLVTGVIVAQYVFQISEKICFVSDAVLLRIPAKKRFRKYYKPCKNCGWGNHCASDLLDKKEKKILKSLYSDHKNQFQVIHKIKNTSQYELDQNNFEIGKEKSVSNNKVGYLYNTSSQYPHNNHNSDKIGGKYAKQNDDII